MNVYTYYDARPDAEPGQAAQFRLWEATWTNCGWNPRILTARKARSSPLHDAVVSRVAQPEIAYPWLALHAAGGGWLIPKSVLNKHFKPARRRNRLIFYHPGILWATRRGIEDVLRTAWTKDWDKFFLKHFVTKDLFCVD